MQRIDMPQRQALICHLIEEMRRNMSWAGHTHIQKCVLFLQGLFKTPTNYEFVLHLHGPYSFELRNDLTLMRTRSQLGVEERPGYGPSFTLGTRGNISIKTKSPYGTAIEFVAEELSWNDVRLLERLSTAFHLQNTLPDLDDNEVARELTRLKPHISHEQSVDAVSGVNHLRQKAANISS